MSAHEAPYRSLWLRQALDTEDSTVPAVLEGTVHADVCIVGGGFTGMWTALRLKEAEPSLDLVLLEADICGGGASGRNGGFVMSWWSKFGTLKKMCGVEEAVRLARASADAVAGIGAFCEEHRIDAHFRHDGWLWTATNESQNHAWEATVDSTRAAGEDIFVPLTSEEVVRRSGSPRHLAGVYEPSGATVQPALLARGLRKVILDLGVRVFEQTSMTKLTRSNPALISTTTGTLKANAVVLATNAWSAQLPELRRKLVIIASDVIATAPISARLKSIGWTDGMSVSDSRRLVNYYRTTTDGRIVFGKGGGSLAFGGRVGAAFEGLSPRALEVQQQFHMIYPMLHDIEADVSWRGPIDYSLTGLPFFAHIDKRSHIIVGAGFSGNGVGPAFVAGRILASMALERKDEWTKTGLAGVPKGQLPIEPLRYVGGRAVRFAIARKEAREDRGKSVDLLTRRVSQLDPTSFVDRSTSTKPE
jgi:putative aminophosphonate oxidoreductase